MSNIDIEAGFHSSQTKRDSHIIDIGHFKKKGLRMLLLARATEPALSLSYTRPRLALARDARFT